jgi:hypothetical protein
VPKVIHVTKSRAPVVCGRCRTELPAGSAYRHWQCFKSPKQKRCMEYACRPRPTDLSGGKMARIYEAAEDFAAEDFDPQGCADAGELTQLVHDFAEFVREVAEEYQESADAISENFEGSSTAEECEEKAQELESWADELEQFDADDNVYSDAHDAWEEKIDCESCDGSGTQPGGSGEPVSCDACGGDGKVKNPEPKPELDLEEAIEAADQIVNECPI